MKNNDNNIVLCKECIYSVEDSMFNELWCGGKLVTSNYHCPNGKKKSNIKGKWIKIGFHVQCDKCKLLFDISSNYCPNCGDKKE